jgi:hypothetical protein
MHKRTRQLLLFFAPDYDNINLALSTWSGIEVVITSRTRNAVCRKAPWVRIPPAPPNNNPTPWGCFFDDRGSNPSGTLPKRCRWQEQRGKSSGCHELGTNGDEWAAFGTSGRISPAPPGGKARQPISRTCFCGFANCSCSKQRASFYQYKTKTIPYLTTKISSKCARFLLCGRKI